MSAQQYTLLLKVDDTAIKDLEARLKNLFGNKNTLLGKLSTTAQPDQKKNLLNLGAIALGTAGLLTATKKLIDIAKESSPMLQNIFKLLNYSIMLIFRPIGDFVGFLLRPIMILLLRKLIIPWFKDTYPMLKKLGTDVGNFLAKAPPEAIAGAVVGGTVAIGLASWKLGSRLIGNMVNSGIANGIKNSGIIEALNGNKQTTTTKKTTPKGQTTLDEETKTTPKGTTTPKGGFQGEARDIYGRTAAEAARDDVVIQKKGTTTSKGSNQKSPKTVGNTLKKGGGSMGSGVKSGLLGWAMAIGEDLLLIGAAAMGNKQAEKILENKKKEWDDWQKMFTNPTQLAYGASMPSSQNMQKPSGSNTKFAGSIVNVYATINSKKDADYLITNMKTKLSK